MPTRASVTSLPALTPVYAAPSLPRASGEASAVAVTVPSVDRAWVIAQRCPRARSRATQRSVTARPSYASWDSATRTCPIGACAMLSRPRAVPRLRVVALGLQESARIAEKWRQTCWASRAPAGDDHRVGTRSATIPSVVPKTATGQLSSTHVIQRCRGAKTRGIARAQLFKPRDRERTRRPCRHAQCALARNLSADEPKSVCPRSRP